MSAAERRKFRSRMWQFRRRRRDLTQQDEDELYALFARLPDLELPYCFREDIAEIFDTAPNRKAASAKLDALREVVADEPELLEFFAFYDRWRDGVLAYFDRRETSAAVEGLNNKARVITRRSYGLKSADSLWRRLALEVNISIARLRKLLFGSRTERTRDATRGQSEPPRPSTDETTPPDE